MPSHMWLLPHLLLRMLEVTVVVVRRVLLVVEEQVPAAHHLWSQRMIKGAIVMVDLTDSWVIAVRHCIYDVVLDSFCIWIRID